MSLPERVRAEVEERLGAGVRSVRPVTGGCINQAMRVELTCGSVFLKYNQQSPAGMFGVEARGLRSLRAAAGELRVAEVLAVRDADGDGLGWIALEWLEPGRRVDRFGERLGRGLAALHRAVGEGGWGWEENGFIGSLPQDNTPAADWPAFWWQRRLAPQLRRAHQAGARPGPPEDWERLARLLPDLLAAGAADGPSLLHGDLWGGNVLAVGAGGEPALVDPAVFRGHREVDLAMSELFGGFDAAFRAAYRECWPLAPGYEGVRREIYQLFYLLVHVNLFGDSYSAQTASVLRQVLRLA